MSNLNELSSLNLDKKKIINQNFLKSKKIFVARCWTCNFYYIDSLLFIKLHDNV